MNLPTEIFGTVIVVHTPEEMGDDKSTQLEGFLTSLERSRVIIDLDGTETIDSQGLTAILNAQEALRALNGDVKVATTNPINRKIFEITQIDKQLDVFDTVIDAVKSFV